MDVGRPKEELGQVDMHELVKEVMRMLAPRENLTIKVRDRLPVVECKLTRAAQALHNLLSSAIKHMGKSHRQITMPCEKNR